MKTKAPSGAFVVPKFKIKTPVPQTGVLLFSPEFLHRKGLCRFCRGLSYVKWWGGEGWGKRCYNALAMFNKTFYKFLLSFVAVIAGTLFFVLIVGLGV